jgi:hypothetical protein
MTTANLHPGKRQKFHHQPGRYPGWESGRLPTGFFVAAGQQCFVMNQ